MLVYVDNDNFSVIEEEFLDIQYIKKLDKYWYFIKS